MKYLKRVTAWVPKSLKDDFDRRVIADGRGAGEILRTLIANWVRENKDSAHGAAGGAAHGATR